MKKLSTLLIGLLLFSGSAMAQDPDSLDETVDGNISIARCVSKGNFDYGLFLRSVFTSDGFYNSFFEPWNDVLVRNQCHGNDILGLLQQQNKMRDRVRDAFFTCSTEKVPTLNKGFYALNAEIYYVRNIVDAEDFSWMPADVLEERLEEDPDQFFTASSELYQEMQEQYVDSGLIEPARFDQLFRQWEFKYAERKRSYVICETATWSEVSERWEEFIETAGGITPAWEDLSDGVQGRIEKIEEAYNHEYGSNAEDETETGFMDYLNGFYAVSINNTPPRSFGEIFDEIANYEEGAGEETPGEGISDIFDEALENVPGGSPAVTQEAILNALGQDEKRIEIDKIRSEIETEFTILYRDLSDNSVSVFAREVNQLNQIIFDSFAPLTTMYRTCVDEVADKQCG